ncbi:hemerythrin domain-containing protein [uncultured Serinicoccus sp.]|uniref:hemerythrin domain-containing protein n=1 Tax=uncultured Serinicoccus sp. TaxID=735514 RepID=UPI0026163AD9|nr:hemerythrin domain-containing protein [uncultured Serinicoccus sp.]
MTSYTIPRPVSGDVVDLILADHRLFEELMRELRDSSSDRESARQAFAAVLIAHGEAEEEKVYPRLRRKEAIDEHEAEHGEEEHAEINRALLDLLECAGTDTQKFDDAVEAMNEVLQHHLTEEELTILNPARDEVSDQDRADLGAAFLEVRGRHLDQGVGIEQVRSLVEQAEQDGLLDDED